ncbi:hypothetical protein AB0M02_16825 [Actinoplanes sp. NPDC051861]|uniref:hypothetical protein n=1 Tax=Actinoplanes sp. NPDC051861 TaxID=3155170 RepID=UPI003440FD5D
MSRENLLRIPPPSLIVCGLLPPLPNPLAPRRGRRPTLRYGRRGRLALRRRGLLGRTRGNRRG